MFHRFPVAARALAVALTSSVACLATAANAGAAQTPFRGAQVHSLWGSVTAAVMNRELDALQSAGANVLRVDVGWATMETSKGHYDQTYLSKLDSLAAGAKSRGIKLIVTLWQTPSWASSGSAWNDAPSNPGDYGDFTRFIAARYASELAAVEVWNEPDIQSNLLASDLPGAYTALVKAAYTGARAAGSSVPVLAAYDSFSFLQALYADGINGFHDGVSVHPYADGANPANTSVTHSFLGEVQKLHAAQLAAGDGTPIWVTEFGWPVGTSHGANTQQEQASYIQEAFGLLDGLPYVMGASVYQLRDMATDPTNAEDNFGLLANDFTPRPAYSAFKAALSGSAPPQPTTNPAPAAPAPALVAVVAVPPPAATAVASVLGPATFPAAAVPTPRSGVTPPATRGGHSAPAPRRRRLTIALRWRRGTLVAHGAAAASAPLTLALVCHRGPSGVRQVVRRFPNIRVSSAGRFRRRLGHLRRLHRCEVIAVGNGAPTKAS